MVSHFRGWDWCPNWTSPYYWGYFISNRYLFGDVKQIPKKGHQSQPLYSTMTLVPSRGSKPICLSKIQLSETAIDFDQTESRQTKRKDFTYENSQVLNITAYAKPIHWWNEWTRGSRLPTLRTTGNVFVTAEPLSIPESGGTLEDMIWYNAPVTNIKDHHQ